MTHHPVQNFIGGRFVNPVNGSWLDNIDPARGTVAGQVANSDADDVRLAVDAASSATTEWGQLPVEQRSAVLNRMADLIDQRCESLAQVESEDGGKPIKRARLIEIPRAAANFRFYAASAISFASELHDSRGQQAVNMTFRQPLGVVGCISPWNLPLYLLTWKVAPALATGNCVIAKPSELTPRTAFELGQIAIDAGLPPGVLNIVQGSGPTAGQALLEHRQIKAISFTGGTSTGRHVASTCAPQLKKFSLELGGKNPNIVFADANYDQALQTSVMTAFANQGQICLCGSRLLVQREIYQQFKQDFVDLAAKLRIGDPADEQTELGALVSRDHFEKVNRYLEIANQGQQGERVLCGGNSATVPGLEGGFFVQPTVVEVTSNQCTLNQEEIFGPVVTIMPFDTEAEAIELANDVDFGLSATIWTSNLNRSMRVSQALDAGVVWVNTWLMRDLRTPFGGMKSSGVGREGGLESLRFFTEPKNVCLAYQADEPT